MVGPTALIKNPAARRVRLGVHAERRHRIDANAGVVDAPRRQIESYDPAGAGREQEHALGTRRIRQQTSQ